MNAPGSRGTVADPPLAQPATLPWAGSPTPTVATPILWIEDVLGAAAGDGLLGRLLDAAPRTARSGAGTPTLRLTAPELAAALTRLTPVAQEILGTDDLAGIVEYAITVHESGQHTALRTDARPDGSAPGPVAFDYFVRRRPSGFSGGQLRIFDVSLRDGREERASTFREICPDHDTLVLYPVTSWYEVRLVRCPSGQAEDSRFAFHGWIS